MNRIKQKDLEYLVGCINKAINSPAARFNIMQAKLNH